MKKNGEAIMELVEYKALILVCSAVVALVVASPALQQLVVLPQTDRMTELALFNQDHNTTFPANVTVGENYRFYVDVTNRLGSCAYYALQIKFRNASQSAPDSFNHTASSLPALSTLYFVVADKDTLELPLDISFQYRLNSNITNHQLDMQSLTFNGVALKDATTISWDSEKSRFYGNLFFELWLYNDTTNTFQYHQRYVSLWFGMETTDLPQRSQ
ncbi:MAG: DUF1616 domain-containing protein [Candidatus Bathyarchaeota archaeon]|nr:DUF1616 domain-containing protein [Candidatus Bathyarchaeota archaeon]